MTPSPTRSNRRDPTTPMPSDPGLAAIPADSTEYQLTVHFPGRLRPNRVETIKVTVTPLQPVNSVLDVGRKKPALAIPLRLVIPGSVLLPAEQTLEPSPFGTADAIFHVTPLAEGLLPDCRLEVLHNGKLDAIPLPLRSEGNSTLAWLIALTIFIPLLLFLPTCWPDLAENGAVERAVSNWFPSTPAAVDQGAQAVYTFLATTGRRFSLSFFAFLALLGLAAVWAVSRRSTVETASNEPFRLVHPTLLPKATPHAPMLIPASADDLGDVGR